MGRFITRPEADCASPLPSESSAPPSPTASRPGTTDRRIPIFSFSSAMGRSFEGNRKNLEDPSGDDGNPHRSPGSFDLRLFVASPVVLEREDPATGGQFVG